MSACVSVAELLYCRLVRVVVDICYTVYFLSHNIVTVTHLYSYTRGWAERAMLVSHVTRKEC